MLGLIRALQAVLPEQARDYVYAGATVQDITDTWTALALRRIGGLVWRDLRRIEERLLELAAEHRDTVMAGRTHGQPGSPVTFGWKAASWADEIRRHLDRLRDGAPRWLVGQLGGGSGQPGVLRRTGPGRAGPLLRRARPGRPRHLLADGARPRRGVRPAARADLRHAGADRRRGVRAAAAGDRRAARGGPGRHGRQHHHAAQAQPGGAASTWTRWPGWPGPAPR